jgi:peptidoglycan/LPS O-acetylase OafA/YrhL
VSGPSGVNAKGLSQIVRESHLPALDGLRAVAVGVVMLYHFTGSAWVPGDLGVGLFFVISGFLITLLLMREADKTGTVSLSQFYARRTLRIFPAYYAFIAVSLAVDFIRGTVWSPGLLASGAAYLMNYYNAFNNHPTTSIAHAWSLANEEQFYLLWPAAFLALRRTSPKARVRWLVGVIGAVALWRSYLYLIGSVGPAYVYNAFDTRCDNLAVGCLVAFLAHRPSNLHLPTRVLSATYAPLVTVALLYLSRVLAPPSYHYSLGFTIDAGLMAVFMVQVTQLVAARDRVWTWLDHPLTRFLGAISYPLYLYHLWGMSGATFLGFGRSPFRIVLATMFSVALACGSYYVIERPFLRIKHRLGRHRAGPVSLLGATQP